MINNKKEAERIALKERPGMRVERTTELEKCFVVNLVPNRYSENDGMYIGGATRVDKKTGKVNLYNPMIENMR